MTQPANQNFNAKNGLSVGGVNGQTGITVIDNAGIFYPTKVIAPGIYENSANITTNYSISVGNNAMSAGPVSIAPGGSVVIPSGSVWKII